MVTESQTTGGFEWGYALPEKSSATSTEYIGYIVSISVFNIELDAVADNF